MHILSQTIGLFLAQSIIHWSDYFCTNQNMEILKSGDVPALVTNFEVLNIVSESVKRRKKEQEERTEIEGGDGRRLRKGDKKLRHRDFIEESVYEYLAATPCAIVKENDLKQLIVSLKGQSTTPLIRKKTKPKTLVKLEDGVVDSNNDSEQLDVNGSNMNEGPNNSGFGLTDAETMQVLNLFPREQVEIHLLIEDLAERLDEDKQNQLLQVIGEVIESSRNNTDDQNGDSAEIK